MPPPQRYPLVSALGRKRTLDRGCLRTVLIDATLQITRIRIPAAAQLSFQCSPSIRLTQVLAAVRSGCWFGSAPTASATARKTLNIDSSYVRSMRQMQVWSIMDSSASEPRTSAFHPFWTPSSLQGQAIASSSGEPKEQGSERKRNTVEQAYDRVL